MIKAGDAFLAPWPDGDIKHLYFVISDPSKNPDKVVLVPMMTWDIYKESTCRIETGEHPFVRHGSYIDYFCGCLQTAAFLEEQIKAKKLKAKPAASAELLEKIREGAGKSDQLPLDCLDVLEDQNLVEPMT